MKKLRILATLVLILLTLTGCSCEHEWKDATCTEPKTCTLCSEIEGEASGHTWEAATCTMPQTCKFCGETTGDFLEHTWAEATCTTPATCTVCDATDGAPTEHNWVDATCTEPKTCSTCGTTEGEKQPHTWLDPTCTEPQTCSFCSETQGAPLGHTLAEETIIAPASCTAEGESSAVCSVCEETVISAIAKTEHEPGEWVVTTEATENTPGERSQSCINCNEVLSTEEFELTAEEIKQAYKDSCGSYTYKEISRNPDNYEGERAYFRGEVIQVVETELAGITFYTLRVDVTRGSYYWEDTVYVNYTEIDSSAGRILEDDIIKMYGTLAGTKTYETVMGASVTIPQFDAEYIEIE